MYTVLYIYDHVYRELLVLYKIYIMCYYIEEKRIRIKKVILSQFVAHLSSVFKNMHKTIKQGLCEYFYNIYS